MRAMPRMGLRVPLMNMTSWWPFVKRVVSPLKKETASQHGPRVCQEGWQDLKGTLEDLREHR